MCNVPRRSGETEVESPHHILTTNSGITSLSVRFDSTSFYSAGFTRPFTDVRLWSSTYCHPIKKKAPGFYDKTTRNRKNSRIVSPTSILSFSYRPTTSWGHRTNESGWIITFKQRHCNRNIVWVLIILILLLGGIQLLFTPGIKWLFSFFFASSSSARAVVFTPPPPN